MPRAGLVNEEWQVIYCIALTFCHNKYDLIDILTILRLSTINKSKNVGLSTNDTAATHSIRISRSGWQQTTLL
jgi:hypothetical protein